MAEKILNTRIALKIDTLERWNSSTIGLKKGELAIATVAATAGTGLTEPVVMIKIGEDGIKTFKDLPWNFHAKAADVLSACKSEASLKSFINNVIADAGIATDEALTALSGRVTTAEGDIDDLEAAVEVLNGDASTEGSIAKQIADAIAALSNVYEAKGTAQTLIADLDVTDNAVTGKYVSAVSEVDGKVVVSREDLPTYTLGSGSTNGTVSFNGADIAVTGLGSAAYTDSKAYDAAGSAATAKTEAIAAAKTEAENQVNALKNGDVKANADAITAIKDHATVDSFGDVMTEMAKYQLAGDYATKAEAQGYANAKDEAISIAKASGDKAQEDLAKYIESNNAAVALKASNADLEAEIARAKLAEAANAEAIERLTNGVSQDEIDSVNDLIKYVKEHGPEVTAMQEDIADNAQAITDEAARADAEEKRLAGLIDGNAEAIQANTDAIAALNGVDGKVAAAAKADIASALDETGIAQVKGIEVDKAAHATTADSATDAAKLGGVAADQYATKTYADQAETDAVTTANAHTDEVIKNYYTKDEADTEFMNSTETGTAIDAKITALNLAATYEPIGAETKAKAYADSLAGNYATAAQGAKADSALQQTDIVTGTANGTIAVKGTDVAVKGLGSAAYTEAGAYATAAQGVLAASALQEIKTTAGGGLKVTNNNQIDFDPDIVFVFNCGDSGVSNA